MRIKPRAPCHTAKVWQVMRKDQTLADGVLRKLGVRGAIASAIALALATPLSAQFQSEGYQFLEAVKEREGDKATEMLSRPGTQIVNTRDITSGDTGLHIVVARGDLLWVRFLLQKGADPNIRNKKGATPLQVATALGFTDGVAALIKGGASIDIADQTGETPLITAVHARNVALVRLLLEKGADPDRNDNSGRSARDYMGLQAGNSLMAKEFADADAKRAAAGTKKDYGPSF